MQRHFPICILLILLMLLEGKHIMRVLFIFMPSILLVSIDIICLSIACNTAPAERSAELLSAGSLQVCM